MNEFIDNWNGKQLGGASQYKSGKWVLALPNPVSEAIEDAIKLAEQQTRLRVPLGMEWIVHKNWYGCH